jgi:hypothetical protein
MEEELLNLIGEYLVKQVKELILTPKPRFTKIGSMPKPKSPYNFSSNGKNGSLYNSVSYVIRDGEIDILMNDYGVDFVFGEGSKPKKPLPRRVVEGELTSWVITKMRKSSKEAKSIAYAISHKLSKVGYKGYRIFNEEFQTETGKYVESLLEQPQYQELVLGDIFDRINIFGNEQYNLAIG